MTPDDLWARTNPKLVAILRGIAPDETEPAISALIGAGFRAIEVPLNSPDPLRSIAIAKATADRLAPGDCLIGAGTVLNEDEAQAVLDTGGNLIVSPNVQPSVIRRAVRGGAVALPGVMTPTEAFHALDAGATGLKFFPASLLGPSGIRAIHAVLPPDCPVLAVGGVDERAFADYLAAGVTGFGLGSSLYKPGATPEAIAENARRAVAAWQALDATAESKDQ